MSASLNDTRTENELTTNYKNADEIISESFLKSPMERWLLGHRHQDDEITNEKRLVGKCVVYFNRKNNKKANKTNKLLWSSFKMSFD